MSPTKRTRPHSRARALGFTLLELMVVLAIMAFAAIAAAQKYRDHLRNLQAQSAADNITLLGKAVATYIGKNTATLSAAPYSDVTLPQLVASNDLSSTFNGTTPWGSDYRIRVQRVGVAPYQYKALVYTTTPWVIDGATRFDLVGAAVMRIGGAGGMTYDATGPVGNGGAWSEPAASLAPASPYVAAGGQLFYNVAYSLMDLDALYLRRDGGNTMNAALQMNANAIVGATNINASGAVSATSVAASGALTGATLATSGDITAGNAITAAGTLTGGSIATAGAITGASLTATGMVRAATMEARDDITITELATRADAPSVTSLKALAPRLVELRSYIIDTDVTNAARHNTTTGTRFLNAATYQIVDGTTIPVPVCATGGTPNIFLIPSKWTGTATGGKFGGVARVTGPFGSYWTLDVKDAQGALGTSVPSADLPNFAAVVRVFCAY